MAKAKTNTATNNRIHHRVHAHVRHHYFRVMPDARHHRVVIWVVFWVVSGIILLQLMYPPARAVPTAMINGQSEAWQHEVALAAHITDLFEATSIQVRLGDDSIEVPLSLLGAEPQTAPMVSELTEYPFWQRYLPLSVFLQRAELDVATLEYTNAVALQACEQLSKDLSYPATNAALEIREGELVATADQPGKTVDADILCRLIQQTDVLLGQTTTIEAPHTLVAAERTAADFAQVESLAKQALSRQIVLIHEDRIFEPSRSEVARWLSIGSDEANGATLDLKRDDLRKYLETISESIGTPAGTTNIQVVNGQEIAREEGATGRQIEYGNVQDSIEQQLFGDAPAVPIELTLVDVSPELLFNNRYTATEAGLEAYVTDAARDYNAKIMVRQLGGEQWEAGAGENDSIPSASTYKIFVAMWLFDQMEQGKTSWNAPMLDTTVSGCFDRMTIASTNTCARAWLSQVGREVMNSYVREHGFSAGTDFAHPLAVHTTAADLTNYMTRLERGELYDAKYRDRLYASLSSHPYRYAVPTGSGAREVYDKVGFLWDYTHDTAVVRHPRGTYVVTIMTKGQSYARIAAITREIERLMYP